MKEHTTITIERSARGWKVSHGGAYHDGLCWDEMLGQVVELTHPDISGPRYPMLTAEQWAQREADMQRRGEENRARWAAEEQARNDAARAELRAEIERELLGAEGRPGTLYPMPTERIVFLGAPPEDPAAAEGSLRLDGADGACGGACDSCTNCGSRGGAS